jgi:hypothetical protein
MIVIAHTLSYHIFLYELLSILFLRKKNIYFNQGEKNGKAIVCN